MPKQSGKSAAKNKPADMRASGRQRVLWKGVVVHSPALMTIDCAISEISASGARVRLGGPVAVGDPMYLVDFKNAQAFRATIAWRKDDVLGMTFSESYDLHSESAGPTPILRQLWLEQVRQSPSGERW
jgi:hypothetical protein